MPTTEGPPDQLAPAPVSVPQAPPTAELSVVIPAHNEAAVIGRLLSALLADARPGEFEVVVVANGCVDETTTVARRFGPAVTVLDTPVAGKFAALRLGDGVATAYPRLYVDADVVLTAADARALRRELATGVRHAAAPARTLDLSGCVWIVRWYYDIWQRLPTVRTGLYGRGVIAVDAEGQRRLAATPEVLGDDLAASLSFGPDEARVVPEARVVVAAPRTVGDLVRRRIRAVTAVTQVDTHLAAGGTAPGGRTVDADETPHAGGGAHRTSRADLVGILRRRPAMLPKMLVFLGVTAVARRRARAAIRSGDFTTWLRDESSRTGS